MNKTKIGLLVISTILISLFMMTYVGQAADNSLQEIKDKGVFVVGLDDGFPPMGFRNNDGDIIGFDIDMAKEAAKRLGVKVKFKPVAWDGVLMSLKNGNIDVIWNGLTITESRKKEIDFSKPYLKDRQIIVVKKDSEVNSKSDLAGKTVGVQLGSSSVSAINSEPEVVKSFKDLRKYPKNTGALMDLRIGRIDAVVVDEVVGRYYISKRPGVYRVLEDNFGEESFGVGIRAEDDSFRKALDKVLDEMKADGTADKIAKDWFASEDILIK